MAPLNEKPAFDSNSSDLLTTGSERRVDGKLKVKTSFSESDECWDSGVCEDIEDEPNWCTSTLSSPKVMDIVQENASQRLWCQVPEVFNSDFFKKLTPTQRKIQETKFEVITSEISYAKSLDILISHFFESESLNDDRVLCKDDREVLFSNIIQVKNCSERFLTELETCWQRDTFLQDIGESILLYAEKKFEVYITYCKNQVHQVNILNRLMKSEEFAKVIENLESNPVCKNMSFHCFLILPMQRVTRLRLLVDGILARLSFENPKYDSWKLVLATLNKLVQECNDKARYEGLIEEMKLLNDQIDFREVGKIDFLTSGRLLVKKGQLLHLFCSDDPCTLGISSRNSISVVPSCFLPFGRKIIKQPVHLFLFTDLLIIAKKKSDENFIVLDYCKRDLVDTSAGDPTILQELPQKYFSEYQKKIFHLFILKNCENRKIEMTLSVSKEFEKKQWLEALGSLHPSGLNE